MPSNLFVSFCKTVWSGPSNFQGGRVAGSLGLQNQWDNPPKQCNLRFGTLLTTVTPEILAMSQTRNYSKVPGQSICFNLFLPKYSQSFSFFFCFSKRLWIATQSNLQRKGGGVLAVYSHMIGDLTELHILNPKTT